MTKSSLTLSLNVTVLHILAPKVEQSALRNHLIAEDSKATEEVLVILCELLVMVFVLNFFFEEAQDALDDDGENLVLHQVLRVLQSLRRIYPSDV